MSPANRPPRAAGPLGAEVDQARYDRGAAVLADVGGAAGQRAVNAVAQVAPALAHHVVAYGFGDIYARPGLTPPQRQLVTPGVLTALGGCEPQLEVHQRRPDDGGDRGGAHPRRCLLRHPEAFTALSVAEGASAPR